MGCRSPLPGKIQTVPRSEVAAVLVLAMHLEYDSVVSDNLVFVDAFKKGYDFCRKILNSDIYIELFRQLRDRRVCMSVYWIPSHLDDPDKAAKVEIPSWVTKHHVIGNGHADRLVRASSKDYDLDIDVAKPVLDHLKLVGRIQRRIAAVVCEMPHRPRTKSRKDTTPVSRVSLQQLIDNTNHSFGEVNFFYKCMACLHSCSVSSPALRQFLQQECVSCKISDAGFKVHGQVSINGVPTHPSHALMCIGGCFCCSKCGFYGDKKFVKLRHSCVGPLSRTHHGNIALAEAAQGVAPFKRFNVNVSSDRAVKARSTRTAASCSRGAPLGNEAFPVRIEHFHPGGQHVSSALTHHSPIIAPAPSLPPSGFSSNLADLVDLQDAGEPVVWPTGFSRSTAIEFMEDVKLALGIGRLYKQ